MSPLMKVRETKKMRSKFLQQVVPKALVYPVTMTVGAAITSEYIAHVDTNGALGLMRSACIHFQSGVTSAGTTTITPTIEESDDHSTWVAVVLKTGQTLPTITPTNAVKDDDYFFLDVSRLKKYFHVIFTPTGTGAAYSSFAAEVTLGDGSIEWLPRGTTPPVIYSKA